MKLLNLDELSAVTRQVTIKGVQYDIHDQTVGQMIDALREAKKYESGYAENPDRIFQEMVKTCQRILPDCPEDVLRSLKFKQLTALLEFANAPDEEVVAGAKAQDETEGNAEGK